MENFEGSPDARLFLNLNKKPDKNYKLTYYNYFKSNTPH